MSGITFKWHLIDQGWLLVSVGTGKQSILLNDDGEVDCFCIQEWTSTGLMPTYEKIIAGKPSRDKLIEHGRYPERPCEIEHKGFTITPQFLGVIVSNGIETQSLNMSIKQAIELIDKIVF
jgi:hypothetical protein